MSKKKAEPFTIGGSDRVKKPVFTEEMKRTTLSSCPICCPYTSS